MAEVGPQRRKSKDGRLLHCCCVCLKLEPWNDKGWSYYASVKEMDDATPYPKFCSPGCQAKGGEDAKDITADMKRIAKENEWRDPIPEYRPPTYADALDRQRRTKNRASTAASLPETPE